MKTRDEAAKDARKLLLENESRAAVAVVGEFKELARRLESEINLLSNQIAVYNSQAENSLSLLIQQKRLERILAAVRREIAVSSIPLALITTKTQTAAVKIAENQIKVSADLDAKRFSFDLESVREMAGSSALGSTLDVYFERLTRPVRLALFRAVTFGLAAGRPSKIIAAEITKAVNSTASNALTIVRTETNRVYRAATQEFYTSAKIKKYRWLSALDLNTCAVCWSMHGKIFNTKTPFGTHINCRCTMVAVLPKDTKSATGAERFAQLTQAQQIAVLGAKRRELYMQGANLSDFVETFQTPFGLSRGIKNLDNVKFKANPRKK